MTLRVGSRLERDVTEEVAALIARRGPGMPRGYASGTDRRARFLLRTVREIVEDGSDRARRGLLAEARELRNAEVAWTTRLGEKLLDVDWSAPAPNLVAAATTQQPMMGRRFGEWWEDWVPRPAERAIVARVQAGMVAGESTPQIIRGLRGLPQTQFAGAPFSVPRHALATMARTTATHVANQARLLSFRANRKVVKRVRWVSTLDTRTSEICIALDGQTWAIGEAHPTAPAHPGCRSLLIPDFGTPLGTRASMDGPVSADLSVEEWLRRQPAARTDASFGPTRARAFRAGTLSARDMLDDAMTRPLTIAELVDRGRLTLN